MARALYYDAEVILLDDPLSALDAHVGQALFETLSQRLRRQGKTVVLVTHALHVCESEDCSTMRTLTLATVPEVDYI